MPNAVIAHAPDGRFDTDALKREAAAFPGMVKLDETGLTILPHGRPLTRMIARAFDAYDQTKAQHSAAV